MKKAFHKDGLKKIARSLNRFLAILVITAIGVAFFTGLRASGPSMRKSAAAYLEQQNFMDLQLLSPTGFTQGDLEAVEASEGVGQVTASYKLDVLTRTGDRKQTIKLLTYVDGQVNAPLLTSGRLPVAEGECLADASLLEDGLYQIGDVLDFAPGGVLPLEYSLKETSFIIVGFARSPEFLSDQRGSSSIGSGQVDAFVYLPESSFLLPVYTALELKLEEEGLDIFSKEYEDRVEKVKSAIGELPGSEGWYVLSHGENIGIAGFAQDAKRIDTISLVMPILFFLISILVTMTSMTRLVDSDLTLIGTYKAMGYHDLTIGLRYLYYAIAASLAGALIGIVAGYAVFPGLILDAYSTLYSLTELKLAIEPGLILLSVGIAVFMAAVPSFLVALKAMREVPAELMRPAAPIEGKMILLERIRPLWKRFNFSQKVMLRNLFRYKKRLVMTLAGVAGCTALMFTGFALQDSLTTIVGTQYGEVFKYDLEITLKDSASSEERGQLLQVLEDAEGVEESLVAHQETMSLVGEEGSKDVGVVALDLLDPSWREYFDLHERRSGAALEPGEDGVIVSEKLSDLFGLKVGDGFVLKTASGSEAEVEVGGIMENYFGHYVFLSDRQYASLFGSEPQENMVYSLLSDTSAEGEELISSRVIELGGVSGLAFASYYREVVQGSLDAIHFVVLVLILSAAALVFVVLFSLTSINIEERKRELATIKVLGFTRRELLGYIFRESFFLTLGGILVGLVLGVFLQRYIISTMEVDLLMFGREILWQSYVYSGVLTMVFSVLVGLFMYRPITRVDMISSLKSVE